MVTPTASFHTGTVSKSTSNTKQQFKGNQNKRNNGNSNTKSCVYCQQPHSSLECTNIVDREKRYDIIKQKGYVSTVSERCSWCYHIERVMISCLPPVCTFPWLLLHVTICYPNCYFRVLVSIFFSFRRLIFQTKYM
jgi:hypothetical protein